MLLPPSEKIGLTLLSSATLLAIFGGRVKDVESILVDERIPEGWESRIRKPYGLTFATFNTFVLPLEFGIDEKKYRAKVAAESKTTEAAPIPDEGEASNTV